MLDQTDKRILDIIQGDFPLASRPYKVIAEQTDLSEEEVLTRVNNMRKNKIIRRLGANFQSAKLGFRSTLCAAKVPDEKMEEFVALVNSYKGVTHNYLRRHDYNIWFTFIGSSWESVCNQLLEIENKTGIKILNLPAKELYKIKVNFKLED
ncbi:AsnC family transcriptional regulator [Desulfovibrio litoralis]|uniref:siroheme decarboxylase n=1 Tax=Desulfovibrio litoralis DSM 11393 TaxID=1121455 RepID=A0A1M7RTS2_9BACT|nr:AsnC family transcriptional regulator [Desulfovibrio litoralis]SHN49536.1 DNA-binding transcriptional regulator, Lrp family [Desulfovibrio litoralis DSM 11393]